MAHVSSWFEWESYSSSNSIVLLSHWSHLGGGLYHLRHTWHFFCIHNISTRNGSGTLWPKSILHPYPDGSLCGDSDSLKIKGKKQLRFFYMNHSHPWAVLSKRNQSPLSFEVTIHFLKVKSHHDSQTLHNLCCFTVIASFLSCVVANDRSAPPATVLWPWWPHPPRWRWWCCSDGSRLERRRAPEGLGRSRCWRLRQQRLRRATLEKLLAAPMILRQFQPLPHLLAWMRLGNGWEQKIVK